MRLSIPLPNRSGWKMKPQRSSFLVLEHAATASTLLVGLWREDDRMNAETCETRARLLRDLPKRSDNVLSSDTVAVPEEFNTQVDLGFRQEKEGAPLSGWALAFGGLGRECFAFIYTTTAAGDGAERIVGDRLAVIKTLTLEGIERRIGGEVQREAPP